MTVKEKFLQEEWQLITNGPEWIFAALAAADGNVAIMTKAKESKAFKNVVKNYSSSSQLVQEVLEDKTKISREIKSATLSEAEQSLDKINKILDSKLSPPEVGQYRKFLTSVADSVAEAAGEGALGLGQKISKNEQNALDKIKEALKPLKVVKVEARPTPKLGAKPKAKPTAAKPVAPTSTAKPAPRQVARPAQKPPLGAAPKKPAPTARPMPTPSIPQVPAQESVKKQEFIAEHTIASGETLSHVSLKYYNSAIKAKWMLIYEANKDVIGDNPNRVVPGMVLKIPKLED
jgi:hypothetical protein